jgi:hypothetical protein
MLTGYKNFLLVILLLLLTSCSSAEHQEALRLYEIAKANKNITQLTTALTTLAKLAPEEYQAEFIKVAEAKKRLEQAQHAKNQDNNYLAYLASHDSYRSLPSGESKKILISSGKALLPILKAQLAIDKSFQYRPKQLTTLFEKYSLLPVSNWDLIEVNNTVKQLSKAVFELDKALIQIEIATPNTEIAEISLWQSAITNQMTIVAQARNHFANLARYKSAIELITLNQALTAESKKLLSLVRPKLAQESMYKSFQKAKDKYAPFQNIITNISLAENLSAKDIHTLWYKNWQNIEIAILAPADEFEHYPAKSEKRTRQLATYLNKNNITIPTLADSFDNKTRLSQKQPQLTVLTDKLKEDKTLLL